MYQKIIAFRAEGLANEIKELQGQLADYNAVKIRTKIFMNSQSCLHFDLLFKSFIFFAIVIHSHVLSLCHSYFYAYSI